MAKINRYGRQVFLSREEIRLLRLLVGIEIISTNDNLRMYDDQPEKALSTYDQEAIREYQRTLDLCQRLTGDGEKDKSGKLWYYVAADEEPL